MITTQIITEVEQVFTCQVDGVPSELLLERVYFGSTANSQLIEDEYADYLDERLAESAYC